MHLFPFHNVDSRSLDFLITRKSVFGFPTQAQMMGLLEHFDENITDLTMNITIIFFEWHQKIRPTYIFYDHGLNSAGKSIHFRKILYKICWPIVHIPRAATHFSIDSIASIWYSKQPHFYQLMMHSNILWLMQSMCFQYSYMTHQC